MLAISCVAHAAGLLQAVCVACCVLLVDVYHAAVDRVLACRSSVYYL